VGIGLVAVHTPLKYERLFEISLGVALDAIRLGVLAEQRKFRFGMVEVTIQPRRQNFVPAGRGVAGLAGLRKTSTMGIGMTISAVAEGDSGIARLFVRARRVSLLAADQDMRARERVMRKRMIELADADCLPVGRVVTLQAIRSEPAVMLVLMTGDTTRRDSQKCASQILDFDFGAFIA
jgi:hypothetical protein